MRAKKGRIRQIPSLIFYAFLKIEFSTLFEQILRMENGKIVEQLRLSKCSMEQLEVQVQTLVSNIEEQRASTREIQVLFTYLLFWINYALVSQLFVQKKLSLAETKYEQSKAWKETLESRLEKTKISIEELCNEHNKRVTELKSEIETKNSEIGERDNVLHKATVEMEKMKIEIADSNLSFNEKNNHISELEINLRELETQIKTFEVQMEQSETDAIEKEAKIEQLESEKCKLSQEILKLANDLKEKTTAFEAEMRVQSLESEEKLRCLHAQILDKEAMHREEMERVHANLKLSEEFTQKLVLEKDDQAKVVLSQAEDIEKHRMIAEDYSQTNKRLKDDLIIYSNKISGLQAALIAAKEERSLEESAIYELQNILDKNVQELEVSTDDLARCCNDLISNENKSRLKLQNLITGQLAEQKESQNQIADLHKKNAELTNRSNVLERQLKEAEHKADERIKMNLFEAQKHINLQMIGLREEHSSAMAALLSESKILKDKLAASEEEAVRLRNSVDNLKTIEEQNDRLRTELLQESCKVEQLSKDFEDQAHQLVILEKQNQLLKVSSSTGTSNSGSTAPLETMEVKKTLFLSPVPSKEASQKSIEETSSKTLSQKASLSKAESSLSNSLQAKMSIDVLANSQTEGKAGHQHEQECDAGNAMKKRALATSSKAKNTNKRASKKQTTVAVTAVEPATLKKSSHPSNGKSHDLRAWDDNCAEFDLFAT